MVSGMALADTPAGVGEESRQGALPIGSDGRGEGEVATVLFRQGTVIVAVEWIDYVGLPNLEGALDVAHIVAQLLPS
jgi:hypothetical protein